MANQKILDLPSSGSELFADCESFLADLSSKDESMIAGGWRPKHKKGRKGKKGKGKKGKGRSGSSSSGSRSWS